MTTNKKFLLPNLPISPSSQAPDHSSKKNCSPIFQAANFQGDPIFPSAARHCARVMKEVVNACHHLTWSALSRFTLMNPLPCLKTPVILLNPITIAVIHNQSQPPPSAHIPSPSPSEPSSAATIQPFIFSHGQRSSLTSCPSPFIQTLVCRHCTSADYDSI